jgi:hypothetical protein
LYSSFTCFPFFIKFQVMGGFIYTGIS